MTFIPKVIIYGEEPGILPLLREFLFKNGLRDTVVTKDPLEIGRILAEDFWPLVMIDHSEGHAEGFTSFETVYRIHGYELLPFVFLAPAEKRNYATHAKAVGAKGVIRKPFQPDDALRMLRELLPPKNDPATNAALQLSRLLLKGDYERAGAGLVKLQKIPGWAMPCEISLARCEVATGQVARAEDRLKRLLAANEKDVRILCEYGDFLRKHARHFEAIDIYRRIRSVHPELTIKVFDLVMLLLELDEIEDAAFICDELQRDANFRDLGAEGLARIMYFLGLDSWIARYLRAYPAVLKQHSTFLNNLQKV